MRIAYRMTVAYDGTCYHGWQEQSDKPTIAGTLQKTFYNLFKHDIKVVGASRTDAGVHALGQECRFLTTFQIDPQRMMHAWNAALPKEIRIRKLSIAHHDFHPHHNIVQKTYWYTIFIRPPSPFTVRWGTWCGQIDEQKLAEALNHLVGTHDFRPLACDIPPNTATIKTIDSIGVTIHPGNNIIRIAVHGKSFIRSMVRRMVGAAIHAAQGKCSPAYIEQVLDHRIIDNALPTAPAAGLTLARVIYKKTN